MFMCRTGNRFQRNLEVIVNVAGCWNSCTGRIHTDVYIYTFIATAPAE